jgi:predicted nucleic acid-binding protein
MMRCVIDTNVIFSALHKSNAEREHLLFHPDYEYFSCELLWLEIERYEKKLRQHSRRTVEDFDAIHAQLRTTIRIVEDHTISLASIMAAYRLCYAIDLDDAPFVALALDLEIPLWTGDETLRRSLTKRGFTNFFNDSLL